MACKSHETIQSKSSNPVEPLMAPEPLILFLNYRVTNDSTAIFDHIKLVDFRLISGELKKNNLVDNSTLAEGDFKVRILDAKDAVLKELHIKNPLNAEMEYVNDHGIFERKTMRLKTALCSIRTQTTNLCDKVEIEQFHKTTHKILLTHTILKQ